MFLTHNSTLVQSPTARMSDSASEQTSPGLRAPLCRGAHCRHWGAQDLEVECPRSNPGCPSYCPCDPDYFLPLCLQSSAPRWRKRFLFHRNTTGLIRVSTYRAAETVRGSKAALTVGCHDSRLGGPLAFPKFKPRGTLISNELHRIVNNYLAQHLRACSRHPLLLRNEFRPDEMLADTTCCYRKKNACPRPGQHKIARRVRPQAMSPQSLQYHNLK